VNDFREKKKIVVLERVYRTFGEETKDVQNQEECRLLTISVIQMFMRALENHTRVDLLIEDMAVTPHTQNRTRLLIEDLAVMSPAQNRKRRIHIVPAKNRQQASLPNESKVIPASSDSQG
jgi:hypothetical protein